MMHSSRRIFKSQTSSQHEIKELLQALLIGELIAPSDCLWIVSPWLTDIPLLDNRSGNISSLEPTWGRKELYLVEVLKRLMAQGGRLAIVTRPDGHNKTFQKRLRLAAADIGKEDNLYVRERSELHRKGILSDSFYLSGSMNLTHNGVIRLDETVMLETEPGKLAEARIAFHDNYGGVE